MKTFSRIIIASLLMIISYASNAQGINFQGVARSANGTILASSSISLRLSILSKSVDATPEYVEIKKVVTNAQGIFSIVIGDAVAGSTTGSFKTINWVNAPKFLKVEMDPSGGTSYINMGITQLQYVPYSFYSLGVAAENIAGVLPVEKGGTGVGSLDELKTALEITTLDTTSLSNRIDSKMSNSNNMFNNDITVNGLTIGIGSRTNVNTSNTAIGYGALRSNTTGINNTANGWSALQRNTTSSNNTAYGWSALQSNTTSNNNTAIGSWSLQSNTIGTRNTGIGWYALRLNTTGNYNTTTGAGALQNNTTGSNNTSNGTYSLIANSTGSQNTAIGVNSLTNNTIGENNTAVGYRSLFTNLNGNYNTAIGYGADVALDNLSNTTAIGNGAVVSSSNTIQLGNTYVTHVNTSGSVTAASFKKVGGTSSQYLMADGSVSTGTSISDSTIKYLNKRIDSLVSQLFVRSYGKIDSSSLANLNPIIVRNFLDSTFLPRIEFNGNGTYINIGSTNLAATIGNSNITFEFWIKNTLVNSQSQTIFSTGYDNQGQGINASLSSGRLTFSFHNSAHQISLDYPNDSLWHHVAYTNKDRVSTLYLDGIEKRRSNNVGLDIYSSQRVAIGATIEGSNPPIGFFKGTLRKMRISKGANYISSFIPSYTYTKADSTIVFWDLNDLGTRIKATDSSYNGTLYNGVWSVNNAASSINLNDSLVAYYAFSGNANDSSSTGLNGTVVGANLTTDRFGRSNNAYAFNTNQYINVPNSSNFNTYPFSVSLWTSLDSLNNSGGNLFKKYTSAMWNGFNISPSTGANDSSGFIYPYYLTGEGVPNGLIGGYGIPETKFVVNNIRTRTWVHFVMTVDASGGKLYLNGNLIDSLSWRTPAKAPSNNLTWTIGGSSENNSWFKGKIDDVRVYKRALNADEVRYLSTH